MILLGRLGWTTRGSLGGLLLVVLPWAVVVPVKNGEHGLGMVIPVVGLPFMTTLG